MIYITADRRGLNMETYMKNSWKYLIGATLLAAMTTLSACGKGGGSTAAAPGAVGALGQFQGSGCVGTGTWQGSLTVNDMTNYQGFLYENGLCAGYQCAQASGYLQLWITVGQQTGGMLPGQVSFAVRPYLGSVQGQSMSHYADGYINAAQNGILVNYTSNSYGYGINTPYTYGQPGYVQPGVGNPNVPGLQISTQYADPTGGHNVMNVQMTYHGIQIASGSVNGQINYSPYSAQYGAQYGTAQCGFGGGYGGGYGGGAVPYNGGGVIPYGTAPYNPNYTAPNYFPTTGYNPWGLYNARPLAR